MLRNRKTCIKFIEIESALYGDVHWLIELEGRQGDVSSSVHEPLPEVQGCF